MAFEDYATRYRPGLDLVLKGVTFSLKAEEKVRFPSLTTLLGACFLKQSCKC